jgi:osmotically-inducible protein OsmY
MTMGGGMSIEMWLAEDDEVASRSELQRMVFEEFAWEPALDASDIGVTVEDHSVTLSGAVKSFPQRLAAERAARRVRGVQMVRNYLGVIPPASDQRGDREVARTADLVLKSDVLVPRNAVRTTVVGGWVRLEGEVHWDAERRAAAAAVERLVGVKGMANEITIKPAAPPGDLKGRLAAALRRCAGLRGDHIAVETGDGAVRLSGRVRCLAERDEAEKAVWALPGVTSVRDELRVEG